MFLHAAARLGERLPLTDLEQRLIDVVGKYVPADELPSFGQAYRKACTQGPIAMLPEAITSLPVETGYSCADLAAALPALIQEINAQPNVCIVDVSQLADNEPIDTEEYTAAMAEFGGGGVTILTAPSQAAETQGLLNVRLWMHRFKCVRESGESGRDEIYWAVGAGSDTTAKKHFITREYGATSTGDWHDFDSGTYVFDGTVDQYLVAASTTTCAVL
ncbi:hypothetical protein [Streptomyces sp. NPDC040750]|uniref:hypothetical protein n=1 Tax=Streptomyces sp. NPDC040750 TaxID=3154491 RepID=UPI003405ACED